jgi:NitT/TauT family transport system substrate-binding protein/putative hydroxymethylpyrimidine transport system substrate-binding protein
VIQPTATADTLKLVEAGKAEIGLADATDVATQIDQGRDLDAVMAVLERPAGGVIAAARSGIERPRDLVGRTVGITGVPSDNAVLDTIVADDGADPAGVDTVTIGFKGAQSLEAGSVDAFTGFVGDAVQVEHDGVPVRSFRLDDFGGPAYPGLVAFSTGDEVAADPDLVQGFVDATARGYQDTLDDPARSVDALVEENPEIDRRLATASLRAYLPLMRPIGNAPVGSFDDRHLNDFSRWLLDADLASGPVPPARFADGQFTASR